MCLRELFLGGVVLVNLREEDTEEFSDGPREDQAFYFMIIQCIRLPPVKVSTFLCSKLMCSKPDKNIRQVYLPKIILNVPAFFK